MFNNTPYLQNESKCTLQNPERCMHVCPMPPVALTVLSPAVGHGHSGPRPPRLPTTFLLFHFGVNLTANYQGMPNP